MGSDTEYTGSEYAGSEQNPSGSEHTPSGSEHTPSGSEHTPSGSEHTPSSSDTPSGSEHDLETWHFKVIAKVNDQYYQIADTYREKLSFQEVLSACLNARELFQAPLNAYALRSERNSTWLHGIEDAIIQDHTTNDLPFTTTCLEIGLGLEKHESNNYVRGRFIFDITNATDIRYGIEFDTDYSIHSARDYIEHHQTILSSDLKVKLSQFDTWHVISLEAAYYLDTNRCFLLSEFGDAQRIEYFDRLMSEAAEPISELEADKVILKCPRLNAIHNNMHWLRTGLDWGERKFQVGLLVSAFRGKRHVDLSTFNLNLNAVDINELFSELSSEESGEIQSLDLSGIGCLNSKDLSGILKHLPNLKSLFLFNTPQIPLHKKISLLERTDITEFYDTEHFSTGSRSRRRSKFVEFIWWRKSKNPLIFQLPHMLDEERIISALSHFSQNSPFALSDFEVANTFRYGFATSTNSDYGVYPIPVWDGSAPSPLEKDRRTIILLSTELWSSVAYVYRGKAGVVSFDAMSEFMNEKLRLNAPKLEFTKLGSEDLMYAIEDLGIVPDFHIPGSFPVD